MFSLCLELPGCVTLIGTLRYRNEFQHILYYSCANTNNKYECCFTQTSGLDYNFMLAKNSVKRTIHNQKIKAIIDY